jgi:hypothetical protein
VLGQDSFQWKEYSCCILTVQGENSIGLAPDGIMLADPQTQISEEVNEARALLQGTLVFGRTCRIERDRAPSKCCLFAF